MSPIRMEKDVVLACSAAFGSPASSSAISTPEENEHTCDNVNGPQSLQESMTSFPKKELIHGGIGKEKKQFGSLKCKLTEETSKTTNIKGCKNVESNKFSSYSILTDNRVPQNQPRDCDYPLLPCSAETSQGSRCFTTWICKNLACKAVLSSEDSFCRRCSCCICHQFDDNKDPSLWLVCASEMGEKDCCASSCHIECALENKRVGCIDLMQIMNLDGSYCCPSCGKISGIIGSWKRQLAIARDARRVDVLCHRIFLSYRLLSGTSLFKELLQIVEDAKAKLETEVGPLNGVSAKMARGIVSRLSIGNDVQKLCSLGIEKADEWLNSSQPGVWHRDSLPAACRFKFEDIASSSLVLVLKETCSPSSDSIKGYKLWYWQSSEKPCKKEPVIFPRNQRRLLIYDLQPCTEYSFQIISFTDVGNLGHSESKCYTRSSEIIYKHAMHSGKEGNSSRFERDARNQAFKSSGFKIRDVGKVLRQVWAEEGCFDVFCQDKMEEDSCGGSGVVIPETGEEDRAAPTVPRRLDLNTSAVPDLNAEAPMTADCLPFENGWCSDKSRLLNLNGSGDSQAADESRSECRELNIKFQETCDEDSTLAVCSPRQMSGRLGQLDDDFEYCVKVIRWLERSGHIENDFRMKFLTWFSLRSTEQERRVVITFIKTLVEEPTSLAGQLLDSFSEIVSCKKLRTGFCSKLWH